MRVLRSMVPWLGAAAVVAAAACLGGGCYGATQATLVIDTDVPCGSVGQTAITISADAEDAERAPPQANATGCIDGHIGTLVLVPSGSRNGKMAVRVVTGPDPSLCTNENRYQGCIVARRSLRYIEHQSMRLPVVMRASCRDVPCDTATQTCVRGQCVSSAVEAERCLGDGCTEDELLSSTPGANDAGVDANDGEAGTSGCASTCVGRTRRTTCIDGRTDEELCSTVCAAGACATIMDVGAGAQHTCALLSNGDVYCWGVNTLEQLGVGPGPLRNQPTSRAALAQPARSLHTGNSSHTCVITSADDALCWGANGSQQIVQSALNAVAPTGLGAVTGPIVAVAPGATFTCAGTATSLVCRGLNTSAQLGAPGAVEFLVHPNAPVLLTAGATFACMTQRTVPAVRCWGANDTNQLGNTTTGTSSLLTATDVAGLPTEVQQIVAGKDFACAVSVGQVFCWGAGASGQLGGGAFVATAATAVKVLVPGDGVVHMAASGVHACAVKSDGATYCWGQNGSGQLGTAAGGPSATPLLVAMPPALRVATGDNHSCALLKSGEIYCWGRSTSGQLGNGQTSFSAFPPGPVLWP